MPIIARQALLQAATGPRSTVRRPRGLGAGPPPRRVETPPPHVTTRNGESRQLQGGRARRLVLEPRQLGERRQTQCLLPGQAPSQRRAQGVAVAAQRLAQERGRARRVRARSSRAPSARRRRSRRVSVGSRNLCGSRKTRTASDSSTTDTEQTTRAVTRITPSYPCAHTRRRGSRTVQRSIAGPPPFIPRV